jgi:hypothetical protein
LQAVVATIEAAIQRNSIALFAIIIISISKSFWISQSHSRLVGIIYCQRHANSLIVLHSLHISSYLRWLFVLR